MQNTTTASWVSYAALLATFLAHYGWIISTNDAIALVGGIIAVASTIYQHFVTKSVTAKAIANGVTGIK